MDGPRTDIETERQAHLAKPVVDILDPVFESVGSEGPHVADQNEVNKVPDRFALLLRARVHENHRGFLSRSGTGENGPQAGNPGNATAGIGTRPAYGNYNVVAFAPIH